MNRGEVLDNIMDYDGQDFLIDFLVSPIDSPQANTGEFLSNSQSVRGS